jgi:hypothetical protein
MSERCNYVAGAMLVLARLAERPLSRVQGRGSTIREPFSTGARSAATVTIRDETG